MLAPCFDVFIFWRPGALHTHAGPSSHWLAVLLQSFAVLRLRSASGKRIFAAPGNYRDGGASFTL